MWGGEEGDDAARERSARFVGDAAFSATLSVVVVVVFVVVVFVVFRRGDDVVVEIGLLVVVFVFLCLVVEPLR